MLIASTTMFGEGTRPAENPVPNVFGPRGDVVAMAMIAWRGTAVEEVGDFGECFRRSALAHSQRPIVAELSVGVGRG